MQTSFAASTSARCPAEHEDREHDADHEENRRPPTHLAIIDACDAVIAVAAILDCAGTRGHAIDARRALRRGYAARKAVSARRIVRERNLGSSRIDAGRQHQKDKSSSHRWMERPDRGGVQKNRVNCPRNAAPATRVAGRWGRWFRRSPRDERPVQLVHRL